MGLINGLWLAMLGVLGAASLIIARKPDARSLIEKLAPYQGWIGALSALWGLWGIVSAVLHVRWLEFVPVYWITYLADAVLLAALGLLLGVGVFKSFIKDGAANAKLDQVIARLAPYQGTLGLVAIGVGLWMVVSGLLFRVV